MVKIKLLFFFVLMLLMTETSFAQSLPNDVIYEIDPFYCIHEETYPNGTVVAVIFGYVTMSTDSCPVYKDKTIIPYVQITEIELAEVIFDEAVLDEFPVPIIAPHAHAKRADAKDPTCRIGVLLD